MANNPKCPFYHCSETIPCSVHLHLCSPYHFVYCDKIHCFQLAPCPLHQGKVEACIPEFRHFRLKNINFQWHAAVPFVHEEEKDPGPIRGAHTAFAVLMELWNMDAGPRWENAKQHLNVGLIKETPRLGNTSVSMGLAELYFALPNAKSSVAFLNCGNGGIKYQLYHYDRATKIISAKEEYKPGQIPGVKAVKFAELVCCSHVPPVARQVHEQDLMVALAAEAAGAPWIKPTEGSEVPEVFAFITGQLRNHFALELGECKEMNEIVGRIFANGSRRIARPVSELIPLGEETFLLPEDSEATMECLGTSRMYKQVQQVRPGADNLTLEPIVSLGIGMNSTQWCLRLSDGTTHSMQFPGMGMEHPDGRYVGEKIVNLYLKNRNGELDLLLGSIEDCVRRGTCPTIALKSGCLLVLSRPSHPAHMALKEVFASRVLASRNESDMVTLRLTRPESNQTHDLQVPIGYSVPQLCAVAMKVFRTMGQERVQFVMAVDKARNRKITSVTRELNGRTVELRGMADTTYLGVGIEGKDSVITFDSVLPYIPLKWQVKSPKANAIQHACIPLSWIVDKWHLVRDVTHREIGRVKGTEAALIALKDLWLLNRVEWQKHNSSVYVGIMKSTFDCGNSSVSMGLAVQFLTNSALNKENSKFVAFLNCGTGGIKYQLYTIADQDECQQSRIALIAEWKPEKGTFSYLELDERYGYKTPDSKIDNPITTIDGLRDLIQGKLARAPWNLPEWPTKKVPVFAFITGPLRDYWELSGQNSNLEIKAALEEEVAKVFRGARLQFEVRAASEILTPENPHNYFITRQHEGQLELLALRRLYDQLLPGLDAVAALSIERASSRFTMVSDDKQDTGHTDYRKFRSVGGRFAGMNDEKGVTQFGPALSSLFDEDPDINAALVEVVRSSFENNRQPMIALKAGALLMLDSDSELRSQFVKRPPFSLSQELDRSRVDYRPSVARPLNGSSSGSSSSTSSSGAAPTCPLQQVEIKLANLSEPGMIIQRSIRLPITISRLCTEAAFSLGYSTTSFFYVFVAVPSADGDMQLIELTCAEGILTANDLDALYLNSRDVPCLYFSTQKMQRVTPSRDFVELFGIALEIYPSRAEWDGDVALKYPQEDESTITAWTLAAQRPYELGLALKKSRDWLAALGPFQPPPKGPVQRLPRIGDAITSLRLSLPLGQYMGDSTSFADAVQQQLQQLGIEEVKSGDGSFSSSSGGSDSGSTTAATPTKGRRGGSGDSGGGSSRSNNPVEEACARVAQTYHLVVCLVQPDHRPIQRFGEGNLFMWLLFDPAETNWAPLWSPRSYQEFDLLQRITPWLNPRLECTNLDFIKVFAADWANIVAFPVTGLESPLLQQVEQRIFALIEDYVLYAVRAGQRHRLSGTKLLDLQPRESCTLPQWDNFLRDCSSALARCKDGQYKNTVGEAFHRILVELWSGTWYFLEEEWRNTVTADPTKCTTVCQILYLWKERWNQLADMLRSNIEMDRICLRTVNVITILSQLDALVGELSLGNLE